MSWSSSGGFERRGYHHGNLREALVEAALTLIAEKGPAGFTIAEVARLAGVSSAAPYRHFRDADALLAEVALRGFEHLTTALTAAWNDGRPFPVRAFEAVGRAYLAFAITRRCSRHELTLPPIRDCRLPPIAPSACCARRRSGWQQYCRPSGDRRR